MEYVTECNENKCLSALEAESLACMEDCLPLFPSNIHTREMGMAWKGHSYWFCLNF